MFHVDGRPVQEKPLVEPTLPFIFEEWKNKIFDPVTWAEFSGGPSSYRTLETDAARGSNVIRLTSDTPNQPQFLFGQMNWQARSGDAGGEISGYDNTAALYYTVMDFEAKLHGLVNVQANQFFMGFVSNTHINTNPRIQDNIIGFILDADGGDLASITDLAAIETVKAFSGPPTIDDQLHHFRIWLFDNKVVFMFDHSIINVHDTNLSNNMVFPFWGIAPLEEGIVSLDITNITIGYRRYPTQIHNEAFAPI